MDHDELVALAEGLLIPTTQSSREDSDAQVAAALEGTSLSDSDPSGSNSSSQSPPSRFLRMGCGWVEREWGNR